jgi:hypothetical protein
LPLTPRRYLLAVLAVLAAAIATPVASGASGSKVVADCVKHLKLTQKYSVGELQNALATLPADISQYSNCQDVIQRALLTAEGKAAGGGSGSRGGGSGGSALPTPVIVVLVVIALAAITLGALAIRRRRG